MRTWWALAIGSASGTICLITGAVAVASHRRLLNLTTLFGACLLAALGIVLMMSQSFGSNASLLFALFFFALTVTLPLGIAAECCYQLGRPAITRKA